MGATFNLVVLSLGANLDQPQVQIEKAYRQIQEEIGEILKYSSFYITEPWGFEAETKFVNSAIFVQSKLDLEALLATCQEIETRIGRKSKSIEGYESRLIDIDIIDFSGLIIESEKIVTPHRLMHLRSFVLEPMSEILPNWKHPIFNKSCLELLKDVSTD